MARYPSGAALHYMIAGGRYFLYRRGMMIISFQFYEYDRFSIRCRYRLAVSRLVRASDAVMLSHASAAISAVSPPKDSTPGMMHSRRLMAARWSTEISVRLRPKARRAQFTRWAVAFLEVKQQSYFRRDRDYFFLISRAISA